jgi:hypothetical protein
MISTIRVVLYYSVYSTRVTAPRLFSIFSRQGNEDYVIYYYDVTIQCPTVKIDAEYSFF